MSKSVLISVNPEWCELIASGIKTVEVRKTKPKLETPFKAYIYCTLPRKSGDIFLVGGKHPVQSNGKVIGEFVCDKVVEFENSMYEPSFAETSVLSCVNFEELALYLGENDFGYGWHISNFVIYDEPKEFDYFRKPIDCHRGKDRYDCVGCWDCEIKRPPQSWCYVEVT